MAYRGHRAKAVPGHRIPNQANYFDYHDASGSMARGPVRNHLRQWVAFKAENRIWKTSPT